MNDKVLEFALSIQARKEACSKMMQQIIDQYRCQPIIVEVRRGGQTVQLGIDWVPVEEIQAPSGAIVKPLRG